MIDLYVKYLPISQYPIQIPSLLDIYSFRKKKNAAYVHDSDSLKDYKNILCVCV